MNNKQAHAIVNPLARSIYSVDYSWSSLRHGLEAYERDYGLNLDPEFQRGHVWSTRQQEHYIENVLRGVVAPETMVIQFNCPYWEFDDYAGDLPREIQIVDGLQRLTAVLRYLDGDVRPFGMSVTDFAGTDFDVKIRHRYRFRFVIHVLQSKDALLKHYLAINAGGTPHSQEEIARVSDMIRPEEAANPAVHPA